MTQAPAHNQTPDALEEALPDVDQVGAAVSECFEALPHEFRAQWELAGDLDAETLVARVEEDFANSPDLRRNILTAYLAQKLGFTWYFSRRSRLTSALWELLNRDVYEELDESDREIVLMIAGSTRRIRPYLEPHAAVATIAIWRNDEGRRANAADLLLSERSLWTDDDWLYNLVRELAARKRELQVDPSRRLLALAQTQLDAGFADTAARMAGLFFTRIHDPWYFGPLRPNIVEACDRASSDPWRRREWLDLMSDAALAGELKHTWIERPMEASIRLARIDAPEREKRLRAYLSKRSFEADHARLQVLYETRLRALRKGDARIGAWLVDEVERCAPTNPTRAMRLLELIVASSDPSRAVTSVRLIRALDRTAPENVDPLIARLVTLYVRTYHLESYAVEIVKRLGPHIDWTKYPDVSDADYDTYSMVSDYEASFEGFEVEYDGVRMAHTDKDAAAYVRYFREKRTHPNVATGFVQNFAAPEEWLATSVGESRLVNDVFNAFMAELESVARSGVHAREAVETFESLGIEIDQLSSITDRPLPGVQHALRARRHRPILLAGLFGALSGGLAPATLGASSVFDAPITMRLATDIAARACWFYGFDPAQDPELPRIILAVALSGSHADPADAHTNLHEFLIRRSLILASLAQGAFGQVLGRSVTSLFESLRQRNSKLPRSRERLVRSLSRREATWRDRFAERASDIALPTVEALIAATLNMALIYDISESAEAVLTDRFLSRKYPDWSPTW